MGPNPYSVQTVQTLAEACATGNAFGDLLCKAQHLLNSLIPLLLALGVVYFVWGVVQYVIGDSEEAKKKGRDKIIYGIIGFAVILSLWGLVNIVVKSLGFDSASLAAPALTPYTPATAGAGGCGTPDSVKGLLDYGTCLIQSSIIPFLFAVAVVMFIWGAIKFFILNADEEAKREQGKQFMIWGIIALAVMLSIWGLVGIVGSTFGLNVHTLPSVKP